MCAVSNPITTANRATATPTADRLSHGGSWDDISNAAARSELTTSQRYADEELGRETW